MKVVLFCGGRGLRLREYSDAMPKPMVPVGYRPVLWHLMKYYAHFGHTDFILCLGHQADVVKDYFLNYDETVTNDFVLAPSRDHARARREGDRPVRRELQLLTNDTADWTITFVDTGLHSSIGERLRAVRHHLGDDKMFLANYADGLTDAPLPAMIEHVRQKNSVASFLRVRPSQSFHCIGADDDGTVHDIRTVGECDVWINGGFFVLRREIFDYMSPGEELVGPPFERLVAERRLTSFRWEGFFAAMDTFKEKQQLDDLHARGDAPWEVWRDEELRRRSWAVRQLVSDPDSLRHDIGSPHQRLVSTSA